MTHADADCHHTAVSVRQCFILHHAANLIAQFQSKLAFNQKDDSNKFFAAIAYDIAVIAIKSFFKRSGYLAQAVITFQMSIKVIIFFEVINIEHEKRRLPGGSDRVLPDFGQTGFNETAVQQTGESVMIGDDFQFFIDFSAFFILEIIQ